LAAFTWEALTHPDDLDADLTQFNRVMRGEIDAYSLEKRFIRKDGQALVVDLSVRCVRGPDGAVDHFIAMLHDISARKHAEEALRTSEAKARSILNSTGAGMALIDRELKVVDCNEPFAARYGTTRAEAVDRRITDFVPEEVVAMRRIVAESVLDTGVPRQAVDEHGGVWYEYTVYPVKNDAGETTMVVIHSLDITDRVRLQEEKSRLETQYQQAQKMEAIGQLAGGVAHDFNNLLQVIRGYTEVAQIHLAEDAHAQKLLGTIASAGERATTLVAQLLAFSRRQIIQPVRLDLNHVIADLTKMLERVIGENIRVEFSPAQALSGIRADRGMIEQVVMNLCINARDAMAEGGKLSIATEDLSLDLDGCERFGLTAPGAYVMLIVSDTGCGMDAQTMERIYEPFFTTKEFGRGTGLGLATAYGIVKQHDGTTSPRAKSATARRFASCCPRPSAPRPAPPRFSNRSPPAAPKPSCSPRTTRWSANSPRPCCGAPATPSSPPSTASRRSIFLSKTPTRLTSRCST
jgi:PAS domain S-box-containing protein